MVFFGVLALHRRNDLLQLVELSVVLRKTLYLVYGILELLCNEFLTFMAVARLVIVLLNRRVPLSVLFMTMSMSMVMAIMFMLMLHRILRLSR